MSGNCVILSHLRDILGKRLFFETLNACHHIDHNSTKKHGLHKRRHGLSVNSLLIHINHIGTCHYQIKWFWSPLHEELLSVSLELIYLAPKVFRLRSRATFWKRHWICLQYCLQCYHRNIVICK